ncbi:hypothetical protein V6N12_037355 [Hibiscus sabdariffa]|uniref:Zinc knuckle CX2CX4HX4C domain-containing protein n=1 Tax=Hibiscus sabdariffa TaxID=183260 RepID=A0ABR2ASU1_9ROSI
MYRKSIIQEIGKSIGLMIRIDYQTENGRHGRFVRMTVIVDLGKPLISKIFINGRVHIVEYESLPTICFHCGMYDHLQESCAMSRLTSNVEENVTPPVTNQQRTEECSFGPWMMVKTAAAIPRAKLRNKGKSSATPKLTTLISRRKPQVVTLSEFLILTRNLSKASSLNPPSLDQSKHSAVVVDENLNPNILVIPSSLPTLPTTSLVPPASEPPDKQLQPTSGEVPHAPVGASLQFNQTDVISDALGSTHAVAMLE